MLFIALKWINELPQHLSRDTTSWYPVQLSFRKGYRIRVVFLESEILQIYTILFQYSFPFILMLLVKNSFLYMYTKTQFQMKNKYKKNFTNHLTTAVYYNSKKYEVLSLVFIFIIHFCWDTHKTGRKFIQSNLLQKVCPWVITLNSYPEYIVFGWRIRNDFNEMLGVKSMDWWNLS